MKRAAVKADEEDDADDDDEVDNGPGVSSALTGIFKNVSYLLGYMLQQHLLFVSVQDGGGGCLGVEISRTEIRLVKCSGTLRWSPSSNMRYALTVFRFAFLVGDFSLRHLVATYDVHVPADAAGDPNLHASAHDNHCGGRIRR